jgi:hypothetical protein
MQKEILKI